MCQIHAVGNWVPSKFSEKDLVVQVDINVAKS